MSDFTPLMYPVAALLAVSIMALILYIIYRLSGSQTTRDTAIYMMVATFTTVFIVLAGVPWQGALVILLIVAGMIIVSVMKEKGPGGPR